MIVLVVAGCTAAFVLHYKNWTKFEEGNFQVLSGIYRQRVALTDIDSVVWVDKLPKMERKNGFSWLEKEKGVFMDSLTQAEVHFFVDDLHQQKIKVVYQDSIRLYLNLNDSLETVATFEKLKSAIE